MSDLTDIEKGKIYSAALRINRRKYSADGKYGAYTEIAYEASAAQLGIEALKASGWEIVPADALSTAREEGKKEGLEEAANAVAEKLELAFLDKLDTQISGPYRVGLNAALEAIRALKEKQP